MAQSFLSGPNPILMRELRGGLRNVRAFGLIALYIALLGAIVTANFPGDTPISLSPENIATDIASGASKGRELFWNLIKGQVALILIIIPALATGALAQERERQTLQPLMLTPLSPLQIVWGKAGGVLSLVGLMLVATMPLTSLCYLLGGVDTGMIVGSYAGILGLAVFTTGFGLYCSARWHSATKALVSCYAFLPIVLALVLVALPLGASFSGIFCLYLLFVGMVSGWKRGGNSKVAKKMRGAYDNLVYVVVPLAMVGLLYLMLFNRSIGLMVIGIGFVFSYFLMATQWGMLQTARELMVRSDPEAPMRVKIEDIKEEWRQSLSATPPPVATSSLFSSGAASAELIASSFSGYVPGMTSPQEAEKKDANWESIQTEKVVNVPAAPTVLSSRKAKDKKDATYGKVPFLSDKLNPIFAKEMRTGLLGKFEYLFRFSYGITIASQLVLIFVLFMGLYDSNYVVKDYKPYFQWWGQLHLCLLLVFSVWFGARAIAPEREGQTLPQLFTIPLPSRQIIAGKMAAILAFTFYIWVLALPLALLMGLLNLVPLSMALRFLAVEFVFGLLGAAWGLFCSFHLETVRKALATSLTTLAVILLAPGAIPYIWDLIVTLKLGAGQLGKQLMLAFLPVVLAFPVNTTVSPQTANSVSQNYITLFLLLYVVLTIALFAITARNFQRLAREE